MLESYFDDVGEPENYYPVVFLFMLASPGGIACTVLCFGQRKMDRGRPVSFAIRFWEHLVHMAPALGLVLCTVAILSSVLSVSAYVGIKTSRAARTQNQMSQITTAFLNYETEYGVPPPALDPAGFIRALVDANPRRIAFLNVSPKDVDSQGHALDSWGTPFAITYPEPGQLSIRSAGPDRIWGTPDDLSGGTLPGQANAER